MKALNSLNLKKMTLCSDGTKCKTKTPGPKTKTVNIILSRDQDINQDIKRLHDKEKTVPVILTDH